MKNKAKKMRRFKELREDIRVQSTGVSIGVWKRYGQGSKKGQKVERYRYRHAGEAWCVWKALKG